LVYVPTEGHRGCLGTEMSKSTTQEVGTRRRRIFHSEDLSILKVYSTTDITAMTKSREGNISTNLYLETP